MGFNPDGSPNTFPSVAGSDGVVDQAGANHNLIGTPALADRNVIGGFQKGIYSYGPGSDYNVVQNNVVCLRPSGMATAICNIGIDHDFGPKYELDGGYGANQKNVF